MNEHSSRSHLIHMIFIEATNHVTGETRCGKLTLVDLAGSERAGKTGATGNTMKEAQSINRSLSALGNVIAALTSGAKVVPYRENLLTQLMRDCVGGNAKTLMFVNISPADYNASEGFSSLNFAQRCKKVVNKVRTAGRGEVGERGRQREIGESAVGRMAAGRNSKAARAGGGGPRGRQVGNRAGERSEGQGTAVARGGGRGPLGRHAAAKASTPGHAQRHACLRRTATAAARRDRCPQPLSRAARRCGRPRRRCRRSRSRH